jgi:putative transcriptional regulator
MHGEQIKELRIRLGLTQEEFAHRLGVTLCTVNRWENKKSIPSRLAVKQLEQIGEQGAHP